MCHVPVQCSITCPYNAVQSQHVTLQPINSARQLPAFFASSTPNCPSQQPTQAIYRLVHTYPGAGILLCANLPHASLDCTLLPTGLRQFAHT